MHKYFIPSPVIDKKLFQRFVLFEAGLVVLLWIFSPFQLLPTPSEVFSDLSDMLSQGLLYNLCLSWLLNFEAILVATFVSLLVSYASTIPIFKPVALLAGKFRFLSLMGLTFYFTEMSSSTHELKIMLLSFSISVFFITSMDTVIQSIPKEKYDLARTLRMGSWRILWEVVILNQIDKVFDVLRENAAIGWMMLTMVESQVRDADEGVGGILADQNRHFRLAAILGIQFFIFAVGLLQDSGIKIIKNFVCPYASLGLENK